MAFVDEVGDERCFFSKTLDALGIEPDASYSSLDPALRDALVMGRPIASV